MQSSGRVSVAQVDGCFRSNTQRSKGIQLPETKPEMEWFNLNLSTNETREADADKPTLWIAARDGRRTNGAHGSGILQA